MSMADGIMEPTGVLRVTDFATLKKDCRRDDGKIASINPRQQCEPLYELLRVDVVPIRDAEILSDRREPYAARNVPSGTATYISRG